MRRSSESAIALVMTLIMLSVITVVAVAFLALTQRERMAVAQSSQQGDAELMAEAAAQRGMAEFFARYLAANSNLLAADLLVSRNYIRTNGFIVNDPMQPINPLNVNYEYRVGPIPGLNGAGEWEQNIANLYYDPRVPVFVDTNAPGTTTPGPLDFRFFLDFNRNGRFETNGAYPILDVNGNPVLDPTGKRLEMHYVGDPEWIGVLENPFAPHSRTNRFIGRYAYIVLPIGKSLDINYMHNHAKAASTTPASGDGFLRNQGVGPWELNLAAFLADLNTNVWGQANYAYNTNMVLINPSLGLAFRDAFEIYATRFGSYQDIAPAEQLFGVNAVNFANNFIDDFANGPLDLGGKMPTLDDDNLKLAPNFLPWPGSFVRKTTVGARTNFFTPHDFFQTLAPPNVYSNFGNMLLAMAQSEDSYNRYTFYRMLAQLSMDSAPEKPFIDRDQLKAKASATNRAHYVAEPAGKININYSNLHHHAQNMVEWDTNAFFNTVADVLLRSQFSFGVSNIPIHPTNNFYGPTVHRLLQVAANIYDTAHASTNPFPVVFRPHITNDVNGEPIISGYYEDHNASAANLTNWLRQSRGLPMVVGAKKGFPNFNEYVAETVVMATRKLQLRRRDTNSPPHLTNEMFIVGMSNFFGLEAWNSYTNRYTNELDITIANNVTVSLTNSEGLGTIKKDVFSMTQKINNWPGLARPNVIHSDNVPSFIIPLMTNTISVSNGIYRYANAPNRPWLQDIASQTNTFQQQSGFRVPNWQISISNNLVFVLSSGNRIVDFVHLPNLTNVFDLSREFFRTDQATPNEGIAVQCWDTNRPGNSTDIFVPNWGVLKQLEISLNPGLAPNNVWREFSNVGDDAAAIYGFNTFVRPKDYPLNNNTNLVQHAPFSPARKMVISAQWEVNDPLVHYLDEHLKDRNTPGDYKRKLIRPFHDGTQSNQTLRAINDRYRPWGGRPGKSDAGQDFNMAGKDPGVWKSDDWDFPTNKFANIGWLGRVHRGTDWQTIYLKSPVMSLDDWKRYSLDPWSHPTNDWRLLDLFTTAVHPNASHGQSSINQTNFAAWSALLGGVIVLSNITTLDPDVGGYTESYEAMTIEPGSPQLKLIYEGIQRTRETKYQDKVFRSVGDLMLVEELTYNSPFLDQTSAGLVQFPRYVSDYAIERIPQQILSLVKVGDPRYVILAYGQSLRPAENSILTSGDFVGMCTNYQVTGEFVTKTVVQIEGNATTNAPVVKSFNILSSD